MMVPVGGDSKVCYIYFRTNKRVSVTVFNAVTLTHN